MDIGSLITDDFVMEVVLDDAASIFSGFSCGNPRSIAILGEKLQVTQKMFVTLILVKSRRCDWAGNTLLLWYQYKQRRIGKDNPCN